MKAIVCKQLGLPNTLALEDLPSPRAAAGQIIVGVKAVGANFADVLMVQGRHQLTPPPPFIPGMELAGVVKEVGPGVSDYKSGDRVCAYLRHGGAFAEEVAVTVDHAVAPLPDNVDMVAAAAFPLTYGTSFHALADRGRLKPGETVLVLGASGGVGLAAVQLAKIMGARVIACASSAEKLATCRRHGADEVINYETENLRDAVRHLTDDKGVDVVCDQVGGKYAEPALRSMAWNGRYCVVGFASGAIPQIPLNLVLLKGCSILGVAVGSNALRDPTDYRRHLLQMIDWIAAGTLIPVVTASYPLARTADALNDLMQRKVQGKVMIVV
jgi:NADPH2:quinone reductase